MPCCIFDKSGCVAEEWIIRINWTSLCKTLLLVQHKSRETRPLSKFYNFQFCVSRIIFTELYDKATGSNFGRGTLYSNIFHTCLWLSSFHEDECCDSRLSENEPGFLFLINYLWPACCFLFYEKQPHTLIQCPRYLCNWPDIYGFLASSLRCQHSLLKIRYQQYRF